MNLDIKRAFLSPFSDEKWYIKLIFPISMAFLISLIDYKILPHSNSAILSIISIISSLILSGYYIQFQHNEIHSEHSLLPALQSKIWTYIKYGFFSILISLFYLILGALLMIMPNAILSSAMLIIRFSHVSPILMHTITVFSVLTAAIALLTGAFFFIAWMFSLCAYADYLRMNGNENINFFKTFKLISNAKLEVFIFALIAIPIDAFIVFMPKLLGLLNTTNVVSFVVLILIAIIQLVVLNLSAQLYKNTKARIEGNQQENINNFIVDKNAPEIRYCQNCGCEFAYVKRVCPVCGYKNN